MVKVAISGASGNVAQEVFDGLVATGKHEIVLLSRKEIPSSDLPSGVTSIKADYTDEDQLAKALIGVHTLLCFITSQSDPGSVAQKALINAAVKAGVKRYAPSEWASSSFEHMPWYSGKAEIREYLEQLNKDGKVLEYCLFHAGLFVNYFAAPYKTSKHVHPFQMQFDFNGRRAIMIDGSDGGVISFITIADFVDMISRAVEFEGEWPIVGGIQGDPLTVAELVALGEKIRECLRYPDEQDDMQSTVLTSRRLGGPFEIDRLPEEELAQGIVNSRWLPTIDHQVIPVEERPKLARGMVAKMLRAMKAGAFEVSDSWNQILPDKTFTKAEDFLTEAWTGKP